MKLPEWSQQQILFIFKFYLFMYYLAVLSLRCCIRYSLVVLGLLIVVGFLVAEHGL